MRDNSAAWHAPCSVSNKAAKLIGRCISTTAADDDGSEDDDDGGNMDSWGEVVGNAALRRWRICGKLGDESDACDVDSEDDDQPAGDDGNEWARASCECP